MSREPRCGPDVGASRHGLGLSRNVTIQPAVITLRDSDAKSERQGAHPETGKKDRKYDTNAQRQAAYRLRSQQARDRQLAERGLPQLPAIPSIPGQARWTMSLRHAYTLMQTTATEMQDYYDDRSEQWQESEKAETFEDRLQSLTELLDELESLMG